MDRTTNPPITVLIAGRHRTVAGSMASLVRALGGAEIAAQVHSAPEALEIGLALSPDVAIVDLEMSPNCSLVSRLHTECPDTRIIVLADRTNHPDRLVRALAAGAVGAIYSDDDSLTDLVRALRSSSHKTPVVADEATGVLLGSYLSALSEKRERDLSVIHALAAAVEARDVSTGEHLHRVTELATRCMAEIDESLARNEEVQFGFMLHDVGKIGVPDRILHKPGPLAGPEERVMRRHPELGVRIVSPIGFPSATTDIILRHHEHWDGSGYPGGLARLEIPITARAFAVADAFDAMTSNRPYRAAMSEEQAIHEIRLERGSAYDPDVVDLFLELVS